MADLMGKTLLKDVNYDKLLAYLILGKHMVPLYGKKRNVSIPEETFHSVSKMCQLVTNMSTCDKKCPEC